MRQHLCNASEHLMIALAGDIVGASAAAHHLRFASPCRCGLRWSPVEARLLFLAYEVPNVPMHRPQRCWGG